MASALEKILNMKPLAVLVDRSKAVSRYNALLKLSPSRVFMVTEGRRRLSAKLLERYDVLAVCGNSTTAYTASELAAIRAFVRRGGGLVLAACSGAFELASGRSSAGLGVNAVARIFGFEFLSADELPLDVYAVKGYSRDRLGLTRKGRKLGLALGDIPLGRPGPLKVPSGAAVLLRDKKSRRPVVARVRCGKGCVLAFNDLEMWHHYTAWAAMHWIAQVAPRGRSRAGRPADIIPTAYGETRSKGIVVYHTATTRGRVRKVLELAARVRDEILRILRPAKKPRAWRITLEPGCGDWLDWDGWEGDEEVLSYVGAGLSDAALAGALAEHFYSRVHTHIRSFSPAIFIDGTIQYLKIHMLQKLGFADHARLLRSALCRGRRLDLGRVYFESKDAIQMGRLWLEIEREFGPESFTRFARAVPKKDPLKGIPRGMFGHFDVFAFFLACAFGERAYAWLEERGHSFRRMPLVPAKSKKFKRAMDRRLKRLLVDANEKASDRFDAAVALAQRLSEDKVSLNRCAGLARQKGTSGAFAAAARLVLAKDDRGARALGRFLRAKDEGLSAIAALLLVFETGDRRAAAVLARLTGTQEARFQLSAGHALRLAGDPRAGRFSFENVKGCKLKTVRDGLVKVFATVDGFKVSNAWAEPVFRPAPWGAAYSNYYVDWVHTSPRWRRRGLARVAMAACLANRWVRECSATGLGTGTRNVAHALYRSFGLIDYLFVKNFRKRLGPEKSTHTPRGFRIRRATAADAAAASAFLNDQFASLPEVRVRIDQWSGGTVAWLAFDGKRVVGAAWAIVKGKSALLEHLAVAKIKDKNDKDDLARRERLGSALLQAVHRDLLRRNVKAVKAWRWHDADGFVPRLLAHNGYGSGPSGGVDLARINSLPRFFAEIAPALEQRLKESKTWASWCGAMYVDADRLKAGLIISGGKVAVRKTRPAGTSVTLRGGEAAIERVALGLATPFEEYLQKTLHVTPSVNENTRDLLETLFPRIAGD